MENKQAYRFEYERPLGGRPAWPFVTPAIGPAWIPSVEAVRREIDSNARYLHALEHGRLDAEESVDERADSVRGFRAYAGGYIARMREVFSTHRPGVTI